jgi:hypothetical protein
MDVVCMMRDAEETVASRPRVFKPRGRFVAPLWLEHSPRRFHPCPQAQPDAAQRVRPLSFGCAAPLWCDEVVRAAVRLSQLAHRSPKLPIFQCVFLSTSELERTVVLYETETISYRRTSTSNGSELPNATPPNAPRRQTSCHLPLG